VIPTARWHLPVEQLRVGRQQAGQPCASNPTPRLEACHARVAARSYILRWEWVEAICPEVDKATASATHAQQRDLATWRARAMPYQQVSLGRINSASPLLETTNSAKHNDTATANTRNEWPVDECHMIVVGATHTNEMRWEMTSDTRATSNKQRTTKPLSFLLLSLVSFHTRPSRERHTIALFSYQGMIVTQLRLPSRNHTII